MRDIAEAATADKEHIQQMSATTDKLLAIVKKQQTQIDKLIEINSNLTTNIAKLSSNNSNKNNNRESGGYKKKPYDKKKEKRDVDEAVANGHGCAICGMHRHTKDCFELLKNKDKRPEGWKSIYE